MDYKQALIHEEMNGSDKNAKKVRKQMEYAILMGKKHILILILILNLILSLILSYSLISERDIVSNEFGEIIAFSDELSLQSAKTKTVSLFLDEFNDDILVSLEFNDDGDLYKVTVNQIYLTEEGIQRFANDVEIYEDNKNGL